MRKLSIDGGFFAACTFLALSLTNCEPSNPRSTDDALPSTDVPVADDACSGASGDDGSIPIECVDFRPSTMPAYQEADLEPWWKKECLLDASRPPSFMQCPDLKSTYSCEFVSGLGHVASWLDNELTSLVCHSCPRDPEPYMCNCDDGLSQHWPRPSPESCNYLLMLSSDGHVTVIRTPADLALRFAPIDDPAEALAVVELVGDSVKHLFSRSDFMIAGTRVTGSQEEYATRCSADLLDGTWVETVGTDFIVHTFEVPFYSGCTFDALSTVTYRVSRGGEVTPGVRIVVCNASVPCYD